MTEREKVQQYMSRVTMAHDKLEKIPVTEVEITFVIIKEHHGQVRDAHRELKRACRIYRRQMMIRRIFYWLELHAVSMGYLRFWEVDKP